jgi:hypothetical protein
MAVPEVARRRPRRAAYDDESVEILYLAPNQFSWLTGDREVACIARFLDGRRTGSLAD